MLKELPDPVEGDRLSDQGVVRGSAGDENQQNNGRKGTEGGKKVWVVMLIVMGVERMTHLVFFCLITAVRMRRRKEYQGQLGQIQQEDKQKGCRDKQKGELLGELLGMLGEVFKWRGMSREINRFSYS